MDLLFGYSWFRLQSIAIHCNRRGVWTDTPHTFFLMHFANLIVCILTAWLKTSQDSRCLSAHFTPSTCHPCCHMFERAFVVPSCLSLSLVSLPLVPFLFHSPVLCPAHHLQCRYSRGLLETLHSRRMRSIAPWRYTVLSQIRGKHHPGLNSNLFFVQRCHFACLEI